MAHIYDTKHKYFATAKDIVKNVNRKGSSSLNFYGFIYTDGTSKKTGASACFAGLGYHSNEKPKAYFYAGEFLNCSTRHELNDPRLLTKEMKLAYIKWLISESNWRNAYLIKDKNFVLDHGMVYSTNYNAKFIVQAAIAMRYVCERPATVYAWNLFKDYIDPHAAFVLGHAVYGVGAGNKMSFRNEWGDNHSCLQSGKLTKGGLKNLVGNKPAIDIYRDKMAGGPSRYEGQDCMWNSGKEGKVSFPTIKPPKKVEKKVDVWGNEVDISTGFTPEQAEKLALEFKELNGL